MGYHEVFLKNGSALEFIPLSLVRFNLDNPKQKSIFLFKNTLTFPFWVITSKLLFIHPNQQGKSSLAQGIVSTVLGTSLGAVLGRCQPVDYLWDHF